MILRFRCGDAEVETDTAAATSIALPFDPRLAGSRAFGLRRTATPPVDVGGGRTLAVDRGASINCADLHLNAHGGGCHIEGVGHISRDPWPLATAALPGLWPATLLDVPATRLCESGEHAAGKGAPDDQVLTRATLERALAAATPSVRALAAEPEAFREALVLRSDVGGAIGPDFDFHGGGAPYPTAEAMAFLAALPTRLLVLDLPSLDREDDGGTAPNHAIWWGFPDGDRAVARAARRDRLLVELVRVPPALAAGPFLLQLGVPPIISDAAPAGVWLLPVRTTTSEHAERATGS